VMIPDCGLEEWRVVWIGDLAGGLNPETIDPHRGCPRSLAVGDRGWRCISYLITFLPGILVAHERRAHPVPANGGAPLSRLQFS
jgi:hypothetical protein